MRTLDWFRIILGVFLIAGLSACGTGALDGMFQDADTDITNNYADNHTWYGAMSGYVTDNETGEPIAGVSVRILTNH